MGEDGGMGDDSKSMAVDVRLVRELAELLGDTGLTEIEVEDGGRKIRVARSAAPAPVYHTAPSPPPMAQTGGATAENPSPAPATAAAADHSDAVRSPMVGTAYLAAEPGADPFVSKGDTIKAGDTLLIVEAMKVMNPITAPSDGTVQEILIENAQPVEFDQPLIVIR